MGTSLASGWRFGASFQITPDCLLMAIRKLEIEFTSARRRLIFQRCLQRDG
jgi:hypothetical protein